ncbi:GntR family transcriptional regulator [Roseibium limicola]|uniref:GntR family transcriptional regulator n=1 Tax=Roseibium limicola TaxID=2816037 RepID=A0A939ERQ2_9HYPH|nr:GntR family transcriptional regulator [Roseibium limicola]MBO0346338.1 GntR family transcriptional regulator [Roseibium limicola]
MVTKGPEPETVVSKPRRGQGASTVLEILRSEILELKLAPGAPIDESDLSQRFGMSRTPIREALIKLANDGLVVTLPNRSTIVAPLDLLELPSFYDALTLMYRVTTRLAARHRTAENVVVIRQLQDRYAEAVAAKDVAEMIEVNRHFHSQIARAGRNKYYSDLFERLLDEGRRLLRFYYSSFNDELPKAFLDEHEQMIRAIEVGDVDAADRISKQHADQIVRQIQSYIVDDRRLNADIQL